MLLRWKILTIGFFGAIILRVINSTLRWELIGLDGKEQLWADKKPCIILFWHGRQLFMPWIYLRHRTPTLTLAPTMTVLISQHQDGRMIAQGMRFLGIDSVAGSTTRGGLAALYSLIRKLANNSHIGIAPDGPKGPAKKLKNGALIIAKRSGAHIYPSAFSAERYWKFRSWDGMIFPKPFSRAVMIKGSPVAVQSTLTEAELTSLSQSVEDALNEVTTRADNFFAAHP